MKLRAPLLIPYLKSPYSNKQSLGYYAVKNVSLKSSLRGQLVKCFTTNLPKRLIFLLQEREKLLQCKSFSDFFNENIGMFQILPFEIFSEMLTNDIVVLNNRALFNNGDMSIIVRLFKLLNHTSYARPQSLV